MRRPKTRKPAIQNALTGAAGTYFVAAELSRRGAVVLMTVRNTRGFDLVASSSDGNRFATVEVKSSSNRVSYFPASQPSPNPPPSAFYAFVRIAPGDPIGCPPLKSFEAFIVPASVVLETHYAGGAEGEWAGWSLPASSDESFLNRWDLILDHLGVANQSRP